MIRIAAMGAALAIALPGATAVAQVPVPTITGTRLDVSATGEVTRVPDLARVSAGVVTQATSATEAMSQNARQMERVIAALRRAGIADRDIQTSSINLNPEYRYAENQAPVLTGYRAGNEVTVRFRDLKRTGAIIDALVAQGANQINGPMLGIAEPEAALDEARQKALAAARARAALYARATGMRVGRILAISEGGGGPVYPVPVMAMARDSAQTKIVPGEQALNVTLNVTFELN